MLNIIVYLKFKLNWLRSIFCFLAPPLGLRGRILVPRPGIEPMPPAVEAETPNHWTAREFPMLYFCLLNLETLPGSHFVLSNLHVLVIGLFPLGYTPPVPSLQQTQSSRTTSNALFSVKPSLVSSGSLDHPAIFSQLSIKDLQQ